MQQAPEDAALPEVPALPAALDKRLLCSTQGWG